MSTGFVAVMLVVALSIITSGLASFLLSASNLRFAFDGYRPIGVLL